MELLSFFKWLNCSVLAIPSVILFFGAAILLTIKTGFLQVRAVPRFLSLALQGVKRRKHPSSSHIRTIDSIHALFIALATTIGIGNLVGPSIAIIVGGPG